MLSTCTEKIPAYMVVRDTRVVYILSENELHVSTHISYTYASNSLIITNQQCNDSDNQPSMEIPVQDAMCNHSSNCSEHP